MPAHTFRDPSDIGRAAIWLMGINCVILAVGMAAVIRDTGQVRALRDARRANDFEAEDEAISAIEADEELTNGLLVVTIGGALVAGLVFLRWTYVVAENAHSFSSRIDVSPGWAVGSYFIPILNLWKPYTALKEIWDSSGRNETGSGLLGTWWALHIASVIGDRAYTMFVNAAAERGDLDGLVGMGQFGLVVNAILIAMNVVACLVVRRLGEAQVETHRSGTRATSGPRGDCPACGEPIDPTDTLCPVCGTRVRGIDRGFEEIDDYELDEDEFPERSRNRDNFEL